MNLQLLQLLPMLTVVVTFSIIGNSSCRLKFKPFYFDTVKDDLN